MRITEVTKRVGIYKASVYNLIRGDSFPKPIKFCSISLWIETEVQAWVANKVEAPRRAA